MKGHPMEYELRFIVWCGINDALKKAIERRDIEAAETLKEAVKFYNREFIICGKELEDLLNKLEFFKNDCRLAEVNPMKQV